MATLREWLTDADFDWEGGTIIYHAVGDDSFSPGWSAASDVVSRERIGTNHPVLDREFYSGYGGPECPRIVAFDSSRMYFPAQYDGATWLEKIDIRPEAYLEPDSETPYPGS